MIRRGVEKGLKKLGIEKIDILFLGWISKIPGGRMLDVCNKLVDEGKVDFLGMTGHTRKFHGKMVRASKMPKGEKPMTAADCYRFVLSNPAVDVCLIGPRSEQEMIEGLQALEQGPLTPEEMTRIKVIGDHVHG